MDFLEIQNRIHMGFAYLHLYWEVPTARGWKRGKQPDTEIYPPNMELQLSCISITEMDLSL